MTQTFAMKKPKEQAHVVTLTFDDNNLARELMGAEDVHLKSLEKRLGIDVHVRGNELHLKGIPAHVAAGERVLNHLYRMLKGGCPITGTEVEHAISTVAAHRTAAIEELLSEPLMVSARKKAIFPRSPAQHEYLRLIRTNDIVFSIGPAGTGKTYLAVAMAVASLVRKQFKRIVLTRPAVEAGERLGFLPGDLKEKVDPYLRPMYDALHDMIEPRRVEDMMEEGIIEVAPLAFMRGRTLHSSFVILDEAQNASYHQMKMCLTRLGVDSKMVVTGDVTQIDLPEGNRSGLLEAWRILEHTPGIAFHRFTEIDVVRHELVQKIVKAYQRDENP